ncbi:MAG TPA: AAA family ATPase, partial [Candidatus Limnocylindrales bacterium]
IMTSNVGSSVIASTATGRDDPAAYEAMKRQVTEALRLQFRPEFLNRVDEVIVFHSLSEADLAAIVDLLLADLQRRLAGQDLTLSLTPAARLLIVREGTDPAYGARPLKRTIQRLVENPMARSLLRAEFRPGEAVTADADPAGSVLVFQGDGATVVADAGERRDARTRGTAAEAPASPFALPGLGGRRPDGGDGGSRPN